MRIHNPAITGSLTLSGSNLNISSNGTITTGVWNSTFGSTSNTIISGSFTSVSSSLASRLTTEEGEAEGSVVSSSAQIAADISGSLGSNASLIRTLTAAGISGSIDAATGSMVGNTNITTLGTIGTGTWEGTTVAVDQGAPGATSLSNLITLTTHTSGNYVGTLTGGTGITSTGATTGEGIAHSISVDASQTQITGLSTVTTGVWNSTFGSTANTMISGSLGSNASLIRTLTAASISGSYEGGGSTKISGSSTSTGSFGALSLGTSAPITSVAHIRSTSNNATLTSVQKSLVFSHTGGSYTAGNYHSVLGFARASSDGTTLGAAIAPFMNGDGTFNKLTFHGYNGSALIENMVISGSASANLLTLE